MAYLIDASSLIEAKDRTFCFDVCPGFWDWLDQQNNAANVFSIDRVYTELENGNDALVSWVKQRKSQFFLPTDEPTVAAMSRVSQWVVAADFKQQAQADFLRGADPFLVA